MRMRTSRLMLASLLAGALSLVPAPRASAEVWLKSWDAHGNAVELREYRGKVVALTFASRHTQEEATEVNDTLAENAGDDYQVLSVVDMADIPDFGRGSARKRIAEADRPGLQHLVDDRSRLGRAFGTDPRKEVEILVIDKNGDLRGRFDGLRDLAAAQKRIDELRKE
jgi:hypothetical protein